ncbi:endonuclease domain-containing protein [Candidatus Parcubacteria bacterium]|nr:endonuclease domain-containing protein [Candidatus Parcubacteria bacterium]
MKKKNYKFIPYDKELVSRARELRKDSTQAEKVLWEKVLKDRGVINLKFSRQKPIGDFIMDFYCASLKLAVEVDGEVHDAVRDKERDNVLKEKFGVEVVRYKNEDVLNNIEEVIEDLKNRINNLTHPNPSLVREGSNKKSP